MLILVFCWMLPALSVAGEQREFAYQQQKMGTIFQLLIYCDDAKTADDAAEAAWNRVDQLNNVFSDYDPGSELSQLSRRTDAGPMTEPVDVSDDMWELLCKAVEAAQASDGAFDITVGPLSKLQRQSKKDGKLPDPRKLKEALACIGWRYIKLDREHHRVHLMHAGMQLDVGGIAKGYTSDQVLKLLNHRGITRALCGSAGDITVGDPPPARKDWRVAIQSLKDPQQISDHVQFRNYAVSTSGDTYRSATINGKRYSHIIDPRTGLSLTFRIGVTTLAPSGTTADWSATAVSILGPKKGLEMIERLDGAAARIVTIDDAGTETLYESQRFPQYLLPHDSPASAPATNPLH
ncbi:MAG TPA: FAD:protein FMN transferase [Tepidisphaeraceae bacterium]|jgi:thiamine biosynthesis lipoprotein